MYTRAGVQIADFVQRHSRGLGPVASPVVRAEERVMAMGIMGRLKLEGER